MKDNKLSIVLSGVFAIIFIAFAALTAGNLIKEDGTAKPIEIEYTIAEGTQTNALSQELGAVSSNSVKKSKFPSGILDSLKAAYAVNDNLAGWLTIPGTEVDTAILQASDNKRYLTYDFYENYTSETSSRNYGNLFLDYRCYTDGELSKNMIIHGHTTGRSDGIPKQAFRSLYDYRDKEHFIDCPLIKYSTLYGEHTYKICAVFYSTTQKSADNGYFFNYIYPDMSDSNMVGYIEQVKQRALYETGVTLESTDKIITLSTCIYDYGKSVDTRLVVVGRLLHDGESTDIDSSLVKDNSDYRRPQIWYNSHGQTNPYKNSTTWVPSPN